jgi:hypothetical protein
MKALLVFLTLIGCQACGAEPEIDPELNVIMEHFLKFAPNSGKLDLVQSIKYGDTASDGERGRCEIEKSKVGKWKYDEARTITINREPEFAPVALTVYHELGHCLFDMPHTTGRHDVMNAARAGDMAYWTPERMDTAIQAMFLGLEMP